MSAESQSLPPPNDPNAFESLCLDLWKEVWQDAHAQKNGRCGQPQAGVDVFGQHEGQWVGIQCKQKDNLLWRKVTVKELEAEVRKARRFKPALSQFILATTGPADVKVQERANQFTDEHCRQDLFKVSVFSWREIWKELCDRPKLLRELGPRYWPALWAAFARDFRTEPASLHQLTPPVSDFTGREANLAELRRKVKQGGAAITGLRGMGGAGKTELARRLAAELKSDYPDAQVELNLKGVDAQALSPADVLSAVLRVFHPTARLPERAEELAALLRQTLEGKRALLLLDNAKDARQLAPLLPLPPGCLVLVTSRQHFTLPGLEAVNLGVMEPAEARDLLLKIAPRIGAQAEALAEVCGRLPLALRLAASLLAVSQHFDPAEYARQLRESSQRLQMLDKARECSAEELGLEASFTLSFQQLPPEQQRLFALLALFPASFDRAAATAAWAVEESAAGDVLDRLLRLSLLEWSNVTRRFELHDLLREFARNHAKPEELDAAKRRHAQHFIGVGDKAEELYQKGGENVVRGLALFDRERAHLEAAFDWLESTCNNESAALLVSLVEAVVHTSGLRFHPRQRILWLEAQVKAARLAGDSAGEASALGNLGLAYAGLGDVRKAKEFHKQMLVFAREAGSLRGIAATLGNLGTTFAALGEARKAIELHEQHLAIAREIGERRGEGSALSNLGNAYADLGEVRKAIEFYEQALTIYREIGERRWEGNALANLGVAYVNSGDTHKAVESFEKALLIAREIGDRLVESSALANFGNAYLAWGDARRAIEFYQQALPIAREIGDRDGEARILGNWGSAHLALGDAPKAIELFQQQLAIARVISDRQGSGNALWNSALALDKLGKRAAAIARAEEAVGIYEGIEDPHAAKVRATLAKWKAGRDS